MNQQLRLSLSVLAISPASAFADQMIHMDHNANVGPRHDQWIEHLP
jgi:hypothetical protein